MQNTQFTEAIAKTLIKASTVYSPDRLTAFKNALTHETNSRARWVLSQLIKNAETAKEKSIPLCDDTGIPHAIIELGKDYHISGHFIDHMKKGIALGLKKLPGRPMAVKGDPVSRLEQNSGLYINPDALEVAPLQIKNVDEDTIRLHILMQGGGPEIRGKTYRVFHKHNLSVIIDEIVNWAQEGASLLGCTPCSPAIGIGRTHYEAASLMLEAMTFGRYDIQSDIEREITSRINKIQTGPLGLGGDTTALATFLKIGPQRASGVRIVCLRLCCCVEPRVASIELKDFTN